MPGIAMNELKECNVKQCRTTDVENRNEALTQTRLNMTSKVQNLMGFEVLREAESLVVSFLSPWRQRLRIPNRRTTLQI